MFSVFTVQKKQFEILCRSATGFPRVNSVSLVVFPAGLKPAFNKTKLPCFNITQALHMCTVTLFAARTLATALRGKSSSLTTNQLILKKFNLKNPLQMPTQFAMNVSISNTTTLFYLPK